MHGDLLVGVCTTKGSVGPTNSSVGLTNSSVGLTNHLMRPSLIIFNFSVYLQESDSQINFFFYCKTMNDFQMGWNVKYSKYFADRLVLILFNI